MDHEVEILESYVTKKRDKRAAAQFSHGALKRHGQVEKIITDGLESYPSAMRELGNENRGRWLNNRIGWVKRKFTATEIEFAVLFGLLAIAVGAPLYQWLLG